MTGKKISSIVFVGVLVILTGFVAVKVWAGMCNSSYCDSDTITVQTLSVPSIPSQPYTVSCQSYNSAIFVTWSGSSSTVQEVDLLRVSGNYVPITPSGHITGSVITSSVWYPPQSQGGNYTYSDYPPAPGSYTYVLRVVQSPSNFSYSNQTTCSIGGQPGPTSSDAPTLVQAFANSPSTVYLNWKDNSTSTAGTYQFVVQRMKVTPNNPTSTSASATEDTPTDVFTTVNWKDNTTSTTYYGLIERSTSTYFATTNQFHYENNSQVPLLSKITDTPWIPDSMNPMKSFSKTDGVVNGSLSDAMTYYYRVRECSTLGLGGLYASSTGNAVLNSGPDGEPSVACTWPSAAFSVTTPPYAPTNLSASANGTSEIDLSWTNNSQRASYVEVWRDGSLLSTTSSSATSYADTGLSSDTAHSYTVRACYIGYDAVKGNRVTVCSNQSNASSATTNFVVSVGISPTGGGLVTSNPSGINCGGGNSSCSASFSNGTQVALNASPAVNYTFGGWSGSCSGTGTCSVSGNASVAAKFNSTAPQVTLSVSVSPQNVGNITITPGNGLVSGSGSYTFALGTQVTLTARSVVPSFVFTKWTGGACNNSTNNVCGFTINTSTQVTANFTHSLSSSPNRLMASLATAASSAGSFVKGIAKGFVESVSRVADDIASGFGRVIALFATPSTAEGQTTPYDSYFVSIATTTSPAVIDDGLLPDTVYAYRVKVHYTDGRANPDSAWSTWAAVKTIVASVSSTGKPVPICTANSVCTQSITGVIQSTPDTSRNPQIEKSEGQCITNADCINVGRVNNLFQEK